jgi:hypothetical protein
MSEGGALGAGRTWFVKENEKEVAYNYSFWEEQI